MSKEPNLLEVRSSTQIDPKDFREGILAFLHAKPTLLPAGMKPFQHRVKTPEKQEEQDSKQEDTVDQK